MFQQNNYTNFESNCANQLTDFYMRATLAFNGLRILRLKKACKIFGLNFFRAWVEEIMEFVLDIFHWFTYKMVFGFKSHHQKFNANIKYKQL